MTFSDSLLLNLCCAFLVVCVSGSAYAAPRTFLVSGQIEAVEGSFAPGFASGQTLSGTFVHDTDESNALPGAITTPSTVPGHEFSSFYEFSGAPYGVSLSFPDLPGAFDATLVAVVVNDDLALTADETNGAVPDGIYDWIEVMGSTTTPSCLQPDGVCAPDEFSPADGQEWTVALIADPTWISDGSLIPDDMPPSWTALVVGTEHDLSGNETGVVVGTATVSSPPAAPVPALGPLSVLVSSGLLAAGGLAALRRRVGRSE
jgi:hypothetical protein